MNINLYFIVAREEPKYSGTAVLATGVFSDVPEYYQVHRRATKIEPASVPTQGINRLELPTTFSIP